MSRPFPNLGRLRFGAEALRPLLEHLGIEPAALRDRGLGIAITDHRSSWVRRVTTPAGDYFIKTYSYPTPGDRLRGLWRNTGPWRPSRAAREAEALRWLRQRGFGAPAAVALLEHRRFWMLHWAVLVTRAWPGDPLDRLLPVLPGPERQAVVGQLMAFVRGLHRAGFRDRNLDLRNLLANRANDGSWQLAKLDSPRFCLRPPGTADDGLARADWARLLPQLRALDCAPADVSP